MIPHILLAAKVSHWFGDKKVLYDVNLEVAAGQFVALVGPSGCGKSTFLYAVLGTHPPRSGFIMAGQKEIRHASRDVGIVYQHYSLYDYLTTIENVAFGLMLDQTNIPHRIFHPFKWYKLRKEHLEKARELLVKVGLEKSIHKYPKQLSGGMRQRVAIAQSLIMKPKVLLLDEPFGALDEATRESLQSMLLHLYQENLSAKKLGQTPPHTVVFVTHELNEAFYLADRVVGFSQNWRRPDTEISGCTFGATKVYDKPAPVFAPNDPRDFGKFLDQKEELRNIVFDEKHLVDPNEHVTFWSDYEKGLCEGVLSMVE
jgi:NitT/TauT family transport system ATP-binding protein